MHRCHCSFLHTLMKRDDGASVFLPDNDVFIHLDWIKTCPLLALLKRSHVVIIEKMKETCGHRIKIDGKAHQPTPVKMSRPFTACLKMYLSNRSCKFILEQLQLKLEACLNGLDTSQHANIPPPLCWLPLVTAGYCLWSLVYCWLLLLYRCYLAGFNACRCECVSGCWATVSTLQGSLN